MLSWAEIHQVLYHYGSLLQMCLLLDKWMSVTKIETNLVNHSPTNLHFVIICGVSIKIPSFDETVTIQFPGMPVSGW
jgi:hypothetical protein